MNQRIELEEKASGFGLTFALGVRPSRPVFHIEPKKLLESLSFTILGSLDCHSCVCLGLCFLQAASRD